MMIALRPPCDTPVSVAASAGLAATTGNARGIICLSVTGTIARLISRSRPQCPIFVVSRDGMTCRQSHLNRGCYPFAYTEPRLEVWEDDVNRRIEWCMEKSKRQGFLLKGDSVVAVHGWKEGSSATNTVRVLIVK